MSPRVLLALVVAAVLLLGAAAVALGEDAPVQVVRTQAVDSFPTALGYAFLTAVTAVGATLGGVIGKLYFGSVAKDSALNAEKDARREEAERLLRESTAILKETMATAASDVAALQKLTETVRELVSVVNRLMTLIGEK